MINKKVRKVRVEKKNNNYNVYLDKRLFCLCNDLGSASIIEDFLSGSLLDDNCRLIKEISAANVKNRSLMNQIADRDERDAFLEGKESFEKIKYLYEKINEKEVQIEKQKATINYFENLIRQLNDMINND